MMLMKRRKNGMTKNILVRAMAIAIDDEYVDNGAISGWIGSGWDRLDLWVR